MFLEKTIQRNKQLMETAYKLHQNGMIRPDTYVIDVEQMVANAKHMVERAKEENIQLYVMSKQYGRNPLLTKKLMDVGFSGAVAVDYKEAEVLHAHGIKLGHVGHLVQVPSKLVPKFVAMKPEVWTVYSLEKAKEINEAAKAQNVVQPIMIRVVEPNDVIYEGQESGFTLEEARKFAQEVKELTNVELTGVTSFPCFLYDQAEKKIVPTTNVKTVHQAVEMLRDMGFSMTQINMPSATTTSSIPLLASFGATHGEPGHGLFGTTPLHAASDEVEVPAIVYVSEVAHQFGEKSYCYGGGHYRRSHMDQAIVVTESGWKQTKVIPPSPEAIDYHIGLEGNYHIGATVLMAFRTQLFVTRSDVALVEGTKLLGIYDTLGKRIGDGV